MDLIEISRDDGGEVTHLEQVEVGDLVRRAADAAARRPVTTVASDLVGVTMAADKRRLERVVTNLVENAERHGTGCMAVRVGREGDHVSIAVEDQGPGVPPERRDRIFERFARAGGLRDDGGVGLGLAIVARHVRAHGGTVQVRDRAGGGARFLVSLPLRRTEDR